MPGGSKLDQLLGKAEPISDSGRGSGITELRRREWKNVQQPAAGERSENVRETAVQTPRGLFQHKWFYDAMAQCNQV
ncbi:hypothetical protein BTVI_89025 [Pitangus sulphuratus]|nr:hypothetical protein BTVI_89025 [Pitangus sulphuratus]